MDKDPVEAFRQMIRVCADNMPVETTAGALRPVADHIERLERENSDLRHYVAWLQGKKNPQDNSIPRLELARRQQEGIASAAIDAVKEG